jgi:hypothetical protein
VIKRKPKVHQSDTKLKKALRPGREISESTSATNLENHLVGLVPIPEREPGAKVGFQIRNSLNSFNQLSIKGLLVVLLELWQVLGHLKDTTKKIHK